jgi:hypothetical protein
MYGSIAKHLLVKTAQRRTPRRRPTHLTNRADDRQDEFDSPRSVREPIHQWPGYQLAIAPAPTPTMAEKRTSSAAGSGISAMMQSMM